MNPMYTNENLMMPLIIIVIRQILVDEPISSPLETLCLWIFGFILSLSLSRV